MIIPKKNDLAAPRQPMAPGPHGPAPGPLGYREDGAPVHIYWDSGVRKIQINTKQVYFYQVWGDGDNINSFPFWGIEWEGGGMGNFVPLKGKMSILCGETIVVWLECGRRHC